MVLPTLFVNTPAHSWDPDQRKVLRGLGGGTKKPWMQAFRGTAVHQQTRKSVTPALPNILFLFLVPSPDRPHLLNSDLSCHQQGMRLSATFPVASHHTPGPLGPVLSPTPAPTPWVTTLLVPGPDILSPSASKGPFHTAVPRAVGPLPSTTAPGRAFIGTVGMCAGPAF